MSPDLIFAVANNGILIFWLLLILAPRWRGTQLAVHSIALPLVLGLTYLWLFTRVWIGGEGAPGTSYFTLPGVMALFDSPTGAVMGWIPRGKHAMQQGAAYRIGWSFPASSSH